MGYSEEQLEDMFNRYENVRVWGQFNMFDPRAIECTGLTKSEYLYVMENYSELKDRFGGK